jgi:hypothetical protein
VACYASAAFFAVEVVLSSLSGWCVMRINEMRCGPEPPEPHNELYLLLVVPLVVVSGVALVLVWRAFRLRTGRASAVALITTIVGSGLGVASVVWAALIAMSC